MPQEPTLVPVNVMLRLQPFERPQPPLLANGAAIGFQGDTVVFSFAASDTLRAPRMEGPDAVVDCPVFAQIAMSHSHFAAFMVNFLKTLKTVPIRNELGWEEFAKEFADAGEKAT
jgi:hypothetical protein